MRSSPSVLKAGPVIVSTKARLAPSMSGVKIWESLAEGAEDSGGLIATTLDDGALDGAAPLALPPPFEQAARQSRPSHRTRFIRAPPLAEFYTIAGGLRPAGAWRPLTPARASPMHGHGRLYRHHRRGAGGLPRRLRPRPAPGIQGHRRGGGEFQLPARDD